MKKRIIQFVPLLFVLLSLVFDYFTVQCSFIWRVCYGTVISYISLSFTQPLYFFSLYSIPLALLLIFIPRNIFNSWLKLAAWLLPFACIMIAAQPVSWTGIGINFVFISRDDLARGMAIFVDLLSFMLIAWKYFRSRAAVSR